MPSPFPGMDPYLENPAHWPEFHTSFIVAMKVELNRVLPEGYAARIDEYVWVQESNHGRNLLGKPDLLIPQHGATTPSPRGSSQATLPTVEVEMPQSRTKKIRFVEIVTVEDRRVVTVLELLSPSNKRRGSDRAAYLAKRREDLATVNLVEFDLLRTGDQLPMGRPQPPDADYYGFVCAHNDAPTAKVWAIGLRDPLPVISIPLTDPAEDVSLSLRTCLDWVYETSRYAAQIDYTQPPVPPLRSHDAEWAATLLKKPSRKKK